MADPKPGSRELFGYSVREQLYPGEADFFRKNPSVSGMASDSGHILLNPSSPSSVNRQAVAKNEALRLYMIQRQIVPEFDVTPEQRKAFVGTPYETDEMAIRQTIAARIFSGDPSALATPDQIAWIQKFMEDLQTPAQPPNYFRMLQRR